MDFLKRIFGPGHKNGPTNPSAPSGRPPLPPELLDEFKAWFLGQRLPAIEFVPDPALPVPPRGTRLGGPALLLAEEAWPCDRAGVPLEFLAQLDLDDCAALPGYPADGILQFFVGRDDLHGADFDDLLAGQFMVRWLAPDTPAHLAQQPPLSPELEGTAGDYTPFGSDALREIGIALVPRPITDMIDASNLAADTRIAELHGDYDITSLEDWLMTPEAERPMRHHTGGFPAFAQQDFRDDARWADYDHVLLHLTSADDLLYWGDTGEAVFMIRSRDLARGDFSRVIYSWDCT